MPHQGRHSPGIGHRVAAPPLSSSQETWCPLWSPPLHPPQTAVVQVVHHRTRARWWLWHHSGHMLPSAVSTWLWAGLPAPLLAMFSSICS